MNNQILVSQIEEVTSELGEPDCKLTEPYLIKESPVPGLAVSLEPWLMGYTVQDYMMISSDKILTITEPKSTIIEKYQELLK
jgi:hypothetical protein